MQVYSKIIVTLAIVSAKLVSAAEADDSPIVLPHDAMSADLDGAVRAHFSGATLLKAERKEREKREGELFSINGGFGELKNEVLYKLTLSDALNKKFEVVFDAHAELMATDKFKTTLAALPQNVQTAVELQAPNSMGSTETLDAKLEKGTYKVSGKINGKKINVEVAAVPSVDAVPAEVVRLPYQADPKQHETPVPEPAPIASGKPEIAAAIDGPFRSQFPDATILHIDHKDPTNVTVHTFSIGSTDTKYEITLSDPLNKKFKVIYTDGGRLYSASNFISPLDRLPQAVQAAIEQTTQVSDRGVPLDVRVEHKTLAQTEHEEYKVSGKINGIKVSVVVPIYAANH